MFHRNSSLRLSLLGLALGGLALTPLAADDRDLLRATSSTPFVMILLDTSGSMHWTTTCTQADFNAGKCDQVCPQGDCFAPLNGDDPASKLYQAKEALYAVLSDSQVSNFHFGFATYNQDRLHVRSKHWYYQLSTTAPNNGGIPLRDGEVYPPAGFREVFGRDYDCTTGGEDNFEDKGCFAAEAARLDNDDERTRLGRIPKLGTNRNEDTFVYARVGNTRYQLRYRHVSGNYGDAQIRVEIRKRRCTDTGNSSCDRDTVTKEFVYDLASEANLGGGVLGDGQFIAWDNGALRRVSLSNGSLRRRFGYFRQSDSDVDASNTCEGWDENTDTSDDINNNINLRFENEPRDAAQIAADGFDLDFDGTNDLHGPAIGDVIPFDWRKTNIEKIQHRLAPNLVSGTETVPDFSIARYLTDLPSSNRLSLLDPAKKPIFAEGATPIALSIDDFRTFFNGTQNTCNLTSCDPDINCRKCGIEDYGTQFDNDFNCRRRFLIILTDGDDTCPGDPCVSAKNLLDQASVRTFVVGFGVQQGNNKLGCIAEQGGSGAPLLPQNKEELIADLLQVFGEIREEARSFAAASVPTVQNETSDKVFFSNFTPLQDTAVWPGRMDAFRKPIPLDDAGRPDFSRTCLAFDDMDVIDPAESRQSACHLWNAGELLCGQAPNPAPVPDTTANPNPCFTNTVADLSLPLDPAELKIGAGLDQRRVFYGRGDDDPTELPGELRLFVPPPWQNAFAEEWTDLWNAFNIDASDVNQARNDAESIIREVLQVKTGVIDEADGPREVQYVLGDIFHADPIVFSGPDNQVLFREDLNSVEPPAAEANGYVEYAERHFWRRKMLVVGANDGQLHFFDAGVRKVFTNGFTGEPDPRFTDGTGLELFSYMPRLVMPIVRDQFLGTRHIYSLDGNMTIADAFVDPHQPPGTGPVAAERGWRSILVGGLREGGDVHGTPVKIPDFVSGYYALDLTEPDMLLDEPPDPDIVDRRPVPTPELTTSGQGILPSCMAFENPNDGSDQKTVPNGGQCLAPGSATDKMPFPAELWTFTDQAPPEIEALPRAPGAELPFYLDEDNNGVRDLGDTWSKPVVGRIKIAAGAGSFEDRWVAIFGGGFDSDNANDLLGQERGTFLYMIDVETGQVLYKASLDGAAPAGPAVLDADRDGYLDRVYIGTTEGFVYKVDMTKPPALVNVTINNSRLVGSNLQDPLLNNGDSISVPRITDLDWQPVKIFDTVDAGGVRQPLFHSITTFRVPSLDLFALSFGSGNRHNLFDQSRAESFFYVFVDENYDRTSVGLPRTPANFTILDPATSPPASNDFLITSPEGQRGWILKLALDHEKVLNQPFALVGVLVFVSFSPTPESNEGIDIDGDGVNDACARSGRSRIFVVNALTGDAITNLDLSVDGTKDRFFEIDDFTTAPFIDQTATKNPDDQKGGRNSETVLDPRQQALQDAIRQALSALFPKECRFNPAYSLTVNASRSDTGLVRYATIPVAMCPVDWKKER